MNTTKINKNNKKNGESSHNSSPTEDPAPQSRKEEQPPNAACQRAVTQDPKDGTSEAGLPQASSLGVTSTAGTPRQHTIGTDIAEQPKKLSGAGKKRFSYLLKKGLSREQAYAKALLPMPARKTDGIKPGPKRQRSSEQTPPEANLKKRAKDDQPSTSKAAAITATAAAKQAANNSTTSVKRQPSASYKDVVTGVKMAVLSRDYPNTPLTTEQMNSIQNFILGKILAEKDQTIKPAFLGAVYKAGYMVLHCKDGASTDWLKAAITDAIPWEGASLWATEESKIPHPRIAVGYFPNSQSVETPKILGFLQGQNEGLHVDIWRILRRVERGSNVTLVLAVDQKSAASLMEYKERVNYRFSQVTLKLKTAPVNADALADKMEAVELDAEDESTPSNPNPTPNI